MKSVVIGICLHSGKFLMGRRTSSRFGYEDFWEFPGGKVEEGETDEKALRREFQEELGCHLLSMKFFDLVRWQYSQFKVELRFYLVCLDPEDISLMKLNAHKELKWFHPTDIPHYPMLPANKKILNRLIRIVIANSSITQTF